MTKVLLFALVSCILTQNQANLIGRCDLAKVLHEEDMDGFEGYSLSDWLCLAFVESSFNISKVNENVDGSSDYGLFQINSHYWCNDYRSHTKNLCQVDCQEMLNPNLLSGLSCAKKIVSGAEGMNSWMAWKLHCSGRPLSYWMTGCRLG
ncbi:lysozyme-like protein 6 [Carlito syrichta]|uniref:Lysozyme-like protein 6 n=1 Tax=Carlito syrichta TaxID=1868482 RepID=A0A1U7TW08_CARSF|nr:lysozyme-like protein 6 [Carlito syrichta]